MEKMLYINENCENVSPEKADYTICLTGSYQEIGVDFWSYDVDKTKCTLGMSYWRSRVPPDVMFAPTQEQA